MPVDVLVVSLGSTHGWRVNDEALARSLERAGARVELVSAKPPREVRTFALTDLGWALAARRAAVAGIRSHEPRAVMYSTTTAALLWPRPGAIRFDTLAAESRPGRHGIWQGPLERRRLGQAPLHVPMAAGAGGDPTRTVIVPPPIEPAPVSAAERDIAAVVYASDPVKKGLDRVLEAWAQVRREGEELVVVTEHRVDAPRREDHGVAQLEALADGCVLVTTEAAGPYPARDLARALDPRLVGDDLATALRTALDDPVPGYAARASELLTPFRPEAVDRVVAEELLPRLLGDQSAT